MAKIFWIDVETTGLDPINNALIQVACIVIINGYEVASKEWLIRPFPNDKINQKALEINKRTAEEIEKFPLPEEAHKNIKEFLHKYIDQYNKKDKFYLGGYNVNFDHDFMLHFFKKNKDDFFGSYFNHRLVDPLYILRWLEFEGIIEQLENHKLTSVCERFNIKFDAHDAVEDIKATIKLNNKLKEHLFDYLSDGQRKEEK